MGYAGLGFYESTTLVLLVAPLPFMWLGGRLAEHITGRIEPHVFAQIIGGVLLISGGALLL